jgi:hypothetical protein
MEGWYHSKFKIGRSNIENDENKSVKTAIYVFVCVCPNDVYEWMWSL